MKLLCVDLGDRQDYTAISLLDIVDYVQKAKDALPGSDADFLEGEEKVYEAVLRFLEKMELGSGYPAVVSRVKTIMLNPKIARDKIILLVDATGVGVPVIQMMKEEGLKPIGITITGGKTENMNDLGYTVPKGELVSALQVLFQSRRLKIPKELELKDEFIKELQNFRIKISEKANDIYGADEGYHDDLVISVALGAWYLTRTKHNKVRIKNKQLQKQVKNMSLGSSVSNRFGAIRGKK